MRGPLCTSFWLPKVSSQLSILSVVICNAAVIYVKQNAWRRLRGMGRCKLIKLLMGSDNLRFVYTSKQACVRKGLLALIKLQRGKPGI